MTLPIIHLNGTSRDELIHLRCEVYSALSTVEEALRQMNPNSRDYYPEPGLMEKAIEHHRRRQKIVADLRDEIEKEIGLIEQLGQ